MKKERSNFGQTILEYAMLGAVVSGAVILMSTYVLRSVQETQQQIQKEFRNE